MANLFREKEVKMPTASETVRVNLDVSPEMYATVNRLASEIGEAPSDVFSLAIALLDVAVRGKRSGQKLGLANPGTPLVTEIGI